MSSNDSIIRLPGKVLQGNPVRASDHNAIIDAIAVLAREVRAGKISSSADVGVRRNGGGTTLWDKRPAANNRRPRHPFEVYVDGGKVYVYPGNVALYDGPNDQCHIEHNTVRRMQTIKPKMKGVLMNADPLPFFSVGDDSLEAGTLYQVICYMRTDRKANIVIVEKSDDDQPDIEGYENEPCDVMWILAEVTFKIEDGVLQLDGIDQVWQENVPGVFNSFECDRGDSSDDDSDDDDEDGSESEDDSSDDDDDDDSDGNGSGSDEECGPVPKLSYLNAKVIGIGSLGSFVFPRDSGGLYIPATVYLNIALSLSEVCRGCSFNGRIRIKITRNEGNLEPIEVPIKSEVILYSDYEPAQVSVLSVLPNQFSCGYFKISAEVEANNGAMNLVGECRVEPSDIRPPIFTFANLPFGDGTYDCCGIYWATNKAGYNFVLFDRCGRYIPYGTTGPPLVADPPCLFVTDL